MSPKIKQCIIRVIACVIMQAYQRHSVQVYSICN